MLAEPQLVVEPDLREIRRTPPEVDWTVLELLPRLSAPPVPVPPPWTPVSFEPIQAPATPSRLRRQRTCHPAVEWCVRLVLLGGGIYHLIHGFPATCGG